MSINQSSLNIREMVEGYFLSFPENTELSLAIIDNGDVSYFGYKKNGEILQVDNRMSSFGIGSITKVLSATVLADLVINDGLDIKSPITKYYDFQLIRNIDDCLENLANHTSGFKSRDTDFEANVNTLREYYSSYDEGKLIDSLKTLSLYDDEVYGKYLYSNFGMGLLGYTLSKACGVPFEELLQNRVFDKYNMTNTSTDRDELNNTIVNGLDKDGIETQNWNMNSLVAAGSVYSCVEDLANYIVAHFDNSNTVLELLRKPTFTVDSDMKVGLGIHIVKGSKNSDVFWHNGGGSGYKSAMEFNIEAKSGVVVLSNVSFFNDNHWDIDRICTNIMNMLIDLNID